VKDDLFALINCCLHKGEGVFWSRSIRNWKNHEIMLRGVWPAHVAILQPNYLLNIFSELILVLVRAVFCVKLIEGRKC
jgi:isoprenylcysteine carboxyl methyltransferase (ICMT) family protein YpbQ